jgi:hypothetical protein
MAWHALQSALKFSFLFILTTNFWLQLKLFIVIYFFPQETMVGYLPNYFPPILK